MSQNSLTPKFFFLSLGVLVTLITSVVSFLNLLFGVLNKHFPDALNAVYQYGYSSWDYDSIRASLATLIIVFPVFFVLAYFWNKESKKELGTGDTIVKKWMVYIVLFLTAVVVIVDLVTLVKYFVAGEITTRFIIKVLLVLAVAKIVGLYYLYVLGSLNRFKKIISISSAIVPPVFVITAIVISFFVIGSPSEQRAWRMDERRVQDLQSLQWQVISYWQQKESLPTDIKELSNPLSGFSLPVDPEFTKGLMYEYRVLPAGVIDLPGSRYDGMAKTVLSFELCATFSADMPQGWQEYNNGGGVMPMFESGRDMATSSYPYQGGINESWDHGVGRTCFKRTIDPELYPPFAKELQR